MIKYIKRNEPRPKGDKEANPNSLFLGYCNWSYSKEHHINLTEAINMLNDYNTVYIPYYVRIFNEMPRNILEEFAENNNISISNIQNIHTTLIENTARYIKPL